MHKSTRSAEAGPALNLRNRAIPRKTALRIEPATWTFRTKSVRYSEVALKTISLAAEGDANAGRSRPDRTRLEIEIGPHDICKAKDEVTTMNAAVRHHDDICMNECAAGTKCVSASFLKR